MPPKKPINLKYFQILIFEEFTKSKYYIKSNWKTTWYTAKKGANYYNYQQYPSYVHERFWIIA